MDEIFDAISYSKGASVIRMLHDYIGDEVKRLLSKKTKCRLPNLFTVKNKQTKTIKFMYYIF